jgi:3-methyladenine DNA glycosylase/8-oxoguanine DNA glycosylase
MIITEQTMKPRHKSDQPIALDLEYLPPFDWESLLATFRAHQLPGLERVDDKGYERIFPIAGRRLSSLRVTHNGSRKRSLQLALSNIPEHSVPSIAKSVRRMFDLDVDPKQIAEGLSADPYLSQQWMRYPGLRVARTWDRFETLMTTILGQLVSVSFGRTLIRELMQCGTAARHPQTDEPIFLFPTPEQIASCDLSAVRTSEMRRTAIRSLASLVTSKAIPLEGPVSPKELKRTLLDAPGIGPWSAEYIAMRAFGDDDAFPATDYGLKQEVKRHPEINIKSVRPWRAYAAAVLWKSFAATKGIPDESVL